jgi:hypothetical protein
LKERRMQRQKKKQEEKKKRAGGELENKRRLDRYIEIAADK